MTTTLEKHFQYWSLLTLFSTVSWVSLLNSFEKDMEWSREQRWAFIVAIVSFGMSVLACFLHMGMKNVFSGKMMELGWVLVVLAFWSAGLPTIMDPSHELSVVSWGMVANGNLFFSSWGAFIMSLVLFVSHFQIFFDRFEQTHLFRWSGGSVSSLIVLWSTAKFWKTHCAGDGMLDDMEMTCNRTMFGLVLGAVSFVVCDSLACFQFPKMVEDVCSVMLLPAWCFGVAFLTFEEGPGAALGTLYFASWFALMFVLNIAACTIQEFVAAAMPSGSTTANDDDTPAADDTKAQEAPADDKGVSDEPEEVEEVGETA